MDLGKAFDAMNHGLLLVKLKANAFTKDALKLMCSYLKNGKQSVPSEKKVHGGFP